MNINKVIQDLVNSASDEGCSGGVTVVDKVYVDRLREYLEYQHKAEVERKRIEELKDLREVTAQDMFETDDLDDLKCVDSDLSWVSDGDQLLKKFYYEDEDNPDGDSKVATFVVVFKEGTDKVEDVHINIW